MGAASPTIVGAVDPTFAAAGGPTIVIVTTIPLDAITATTAANAIMIGAPTFPRKL